ncbi:MAG: DUF1326 domain-containing protein [Acidobacteria bacterium]|nr:DUF1326 domain-containing protein [Acidobacteriota bacterium]MCI0719960.1 DUF1326 domain-containing protein [Acidobacteriota bacterium]
MRKLAFLATLALVWVLGFSDAGKQAASKDPVWNMNATVIEACSCPMFCQCYFNSKPAEHAGGPGHEGHGKGHFCKFNNAFKINKGKFGNVVLDGGKFWVSGDLGADFSDGQMDWAVVTFDKALAKEQREAIGKILAHLYPFKWGELTTDEGDIAWTPGKDEARATIDGGKTAEVVLKRFQGMTNMPVVIRNLKYFGAPRNNGFIMMPNVIEAYRKGPKAYEFKGTNGFMITVDIDSKTAPPAAGK